jgi:hypothetical protein
MDMQTAYMDGSLQAFCMWAVGMSLAHCVPRCLCACWTVTYHALCLSVRVLDDLSPGRVAQSRLDAPLTVLKGRIGTQMFTCVTPLLRAKRGIDASPQT